MHNFTQKDKRNLCNRRYFTAAKIKFFKEYCNKKNVVFGDFYLDRLPRKTIFPKIFQKYFQSVRKGCSK